MKIKNTKQCITLADIDNPTLISFAAKSSLIVLILGLACVFAEDIYSLDATDINGDEITFSDFRGKPMLLVNTASKCNMAPSNFPALVDLCNEYEPKGLVCIFFPSAVFGDEEYDTNPEIMANTVSKYDIQNLVMARGDVTKDHAQPVYRWLNSQIGEPQTNFVKVMITSEGKIDKVYPGNFDPSEMEADVEKLLGID